MAIVEDEMEDVLCLQLYHQDVDRANDDILPQGTVFIIKEPYLKLMADGNYGIRVDHLSDIVYLPVGDHRFPRVGSEGLRNTCSYTRAFDCSPTPDEERAICPALCDLESASTSVFLSRKAEALYQLQRYRECCVVLTTHRVEYPDNIQAKNDLTRAVERLVEQVKGRYHFQQLYREASKLRPPCLDHSSHTGPVAVKHSGSRGRGLFTTEAVKAGDLLLCEKAFSYAFAQPGDSEYDKHVSLLISPETNTMTLGAQAELLTMTVQKMHRNPSLASTITDLHHGSYKSVEISDADDAPVVDTFLVERVIFLTSFGCPLPSRETIMSSRLGTYGQKPKYEDEKFHSCGIWPIASYINHSCNSNARGAFIGDMMIVRATRDIAANTEITFW
ncbi:hypothetical protein AJ79_00435 [Helicocarpus griseus UAMH5409]|uniref:SET domain-containing protein n=1 Tax=Helicocarpus griseus UAMH5409 TaxID=1447875 RepID=A0A2B7YBA5_9EURO|nr:hypothetical protein AJ79_00435 [Helicocarpus griseus UAMH5409]